MKSCKSIIILDTQILWSYPRENVNKRQLRTGKAGPMKWSASTLILRVYVHFLGLVEEVEGNRLVSLGSYMKDIESKLIDRINFCSKI